MLLINLIFFIHIKFFFWSGVLGRLQNETLFLQIGHGGEEVHRIHFGKESARNELVYLTDVIRKEIAIFGLIMKLIKTVIILFIENGQLGKYKVQSCKTFFKTPKEYYKSLITPPTLPPHHTHPKANTLSTSTPPHTIPTPSNHPRSS